MTDDGRRYVLRLGQLLFGIGLRVPEPRDIEVVVARGDLLSREATETTGFALIPPLRFPERIVAVARLEVGEVGDRQRTGS